MKHIEIFPIKRNTIKRKKISKMICEDLKKFTLKDGDIIAVSSKIISMSEGRFYRLKKGDPFRVIEREAEFLWNSFAGLKLTIVYDSLTPNSGIDFSNIEKNYAILYPTNPNLKAEEIRLNILLYFGVYVGVILVDSRLFPLRKGTTGIAIGISGILPIIDERGKKDLFGNKLKVTKRSIVDDLAAMAHLNMGESDERTPYVVIRGLGTYVTKKSTNKLKLSVSPSECIYFRTLKQLYKGSN